MSYVEMNDEELLKDYLSWKNPQYGAAQWNLSPECHYHAFCTREFLKKNFPVFEGINVCNVGVGIGQWDDFIGYWLVGKGKLTSIEIRLGQCESLEYRQKREGHTNPSIIWNNDVLDPNLPKNQFDLVTIIGSTVKETGYFKETLDACFSLIKDGGYLMYNGFNNQNSPWLFEEYIKNTTYQIEIKEIHDYYKNWIFHSFKVKK